MNKVIISVFGLDRPGILAAIAGALQGQDCNIENVSQTILQTEFSGIFIVEMPRELTSAQLQAHLRQELAPLDLQIGVKVLHLAQKTVPCPSEPFVITTRGPDRKGLVAGITAVIASHNVNITNLQAVFRGGQAPEDNIMIYEVDIPVETNQAALSRDLRTKAQELGIEINLQHCNIFEAMNRV